MGRKIVFNDQKRINNRLNTQKHRHNKKLKQIHNVQINEKIKQHFEHNHGVNGSNFNDDCVQPPELDGQPEFKDKLRTWAINHRITRKALSDLLVILIGAGFVFLPKDSRTLMSTPVNIPTEILSKGQLWYFGIQKCLENVLCQIRKQYTITMDFNFDGLPISKSSTKQFWPILSAIRELPKIGPFVVGIWSGDGKPLVNEYLRHFAAEMRELIETPITINSQRVIIKFGSVIADTPARSLIKGIVNFNHKRGCQKCTTLGTYNKEFRTISFPNISSSRRSNESFRARTDESHHKETSPIEQLDIDMVMGFPTSDPLHLLELGIMKKCLLRWVFGEKGFNRKWSRSHVDLISRELLKCAALMPKEFHRKQRSLQYLRQWKGVEYRTMLLYTGIVVLKKVLDDDSYKHFLYLCCAVRICSSNSYKSFQSLAHKLFQNYVQNYGKLYGEYRIGSNVHNLSHIVDDLSYHDVGNLMNISTYKFENCLRLLGLQLKHGHLPLQQISRRIIEGFKFKSNFQYEEQPFVPQVFYEFSLYEQNEKAYNQIKITPDIQLSNRRTGDSWFLSSCNNIVKMKYVIQRGSNLVVLGQKIEFKESFFETPLNSSYFHIYLSNGKVSAEVSEFNLPSITGKMMCIPYNRESVFIPLLQSLK